MSRLCDETGAALITALLATMIMLGLGLALLAIVDTQASESASERTRDRAFNLSESVLNNQAFVLGRNWPSTQPTPNNGCFTIDHGFGDTLGATTDAVGASAAAIAATNRLRNNLNPSYTDAAYDGATWQVNTCDDDGSSTVWSDALLTNKSWDVNLNSKIWVRAQATVDGRTRAVVGLVNVRTTPMLDSKYALVSGGLTDDLGASINTVGSNALGGVLDGLLGTTPTVAADPSLPATTPPSSGVTGLRCGATDINLIPASTCVAGTIGALGALPAVSTLLTGGKLEQFPTTTAATANAIGQLRTEAVGTDTYYTASAGGTYAAAPACTFTTNTGTRTANTVVFIERVGTGAATPGTALGAGDQYCYIDVSAGVQWKALVIGSGRVILRGSNTPTAAPLPTISGPQVNTFSGVVYALNLQRHTTADGGQNLGDSASPGREVVRIERGAHVKGSVHADGKSAKVSIIPPPVNINTNALVDTLIPCTTVLAVITCPLRNTIIKALSGVTAIVDALIAEVGLTATTNAILGQVRPQRANYGSAITADVAAMNELSVYGASGVVAGTFRDLQAR